MIHHKHLVASTIVALAVVLIGCDSQGSSSPTGPTISAKNESASLSSSPRSGALHVTKECSQFTRLAGGRWNGDKARAGGGLRIEGDQDLGKRVIDNMAFTI